jgi:AraC-like DNA-binding protein
MHLFDLSANPRTASIDEVARTIGVSRSGLYRAFEPMGGVLTYVRQRRLDRIYATLRAPVETPPSIDGLAKHYGFTGAAKLSDAFQKRFGFSLGDVKPSCVTAGAPRINAGGELDRAAHDVFIDWLRVGEMV